MIGRILYGGAFCVLLPALAVLWCARGGAMMPGWPMPIWWTGVPVAALGAWLIAAAWWALWFKGGGLPMNAFPPRRRVETGVFAWLDHPIYVGAALIAGGVSIIFGSRFGLWVATPTLIGGAAALVWGFERERTDRLLGGRVTPARLSLPAESPEPARAWQRVSALVLVFLPWAVLYEGLGHAPVPDSVDVRLWFERSWPLVGWTVPVYSSGYALALLSVLACRTGSDVRRLMITGRVGTAVGMWCYLAFPLIAPPRGELDGFFGAWLDLERADGLAGRAACPSFHVFWACVGAWALARRWPRAEALWWLWGAAVIAACVTTGMHALIDLPAGVALFALGVNAGRVWALARAASGKIANHWREWRIGPVRVLVHAVYAFAAAFVGALVIDALSGGQHRPALWVIALCGLLGAGVWGQVVEYSGALARPFGYYGHVIGCLLGLGVCWALGLCGWTFAAALACAAPLVQSLGRVRCLVNGCCHGRPCGHAHGIVYTGDRSRVARLAGLKGVPIHPTQTYSIIANLAAFGLLLRGFSAGVPAGVVVGASLMLAGLSRFVEEHYRGEPQTPTVKGLHSYQWLALASVMLGAAVLVTPSPVLTWPGAVSDAFKGANPGPVAEGGVLALLNGWGAMHALAIGVIYAVAMGVDLPMSGRRFARLA